VGGIGWLDLGQWGKRAELREIKIADITNNLAILEFEEGGNGQFSRGHIPISGPCREELYRSLVPFHYDSFYFVVNLGELRK